MISTDDRGIWINVDERLRRYRCQRKPVALCTDVTEAGAKADD
jgi:hypothetical protein